MQSKSVGGAPAPPDDDARVLSGEAAGAKRRSELRKRIAETGLPYQKDYPAFCQRVANFVQNSPGAHIWILGNETNLKVEWPQYEGTTEKITIALYVEAFQLCRSAIKALPGHDGDQVLPQASATQTWDSGLDWVDYHLAMLNAIGPGNLDGIALHTYTQGSDPNLIFSEDRVGAKSRYSQFRAYRDFMAVHPIWAQSLPVYVTETCPVGIGYSADSAGWIPNAYAEIDAWNQGPAVQKIRALALFRWWKRPCCPCYLEGNPEGIADFLEAMNYEYVWR